MRWSLFRKITLSISILIILMSSLLSSFFVRYQTNSIRKGLMAKGSMLAKNLALNAEYGLLIDNHDLLKRLVHTTMQEEDVAYCLIQNPDGDVLVEKSLEKRVEEGSIAQKAKASQGLLIQPYSTKEGSFYDISFPVLTHKVEETREEIIFGPEGFSSSKEGLPEEMVLEKKMPLEEKIGLVRVGISNRGMGLAINETKRTALFLTLLIVLVGIGIASFLTKRITQPIRELVTGSKKIAGGDLNYRVKVTSHDEARLLADEFNLMGEKLSDLYVHLEEKVKTRTKELEETQAKLVSSKKMAAATQIASEAAHEIKNPLAVIKAGIYYLKKTLPGENIQKTIRQLDDAVERATFYINDLLTFSRPPMLKLKSVQVNKVLEESLGELPPEILANMEIEKDLAPNLPELTVDPERLKQVFTNIIKNASEVMEARGRLTIESRLCDDRLQISFTDTGKGIPAEDLSRIFDPFFTTKGKGTGLGLAICQRIIEAHKGEIKVESELGKGTTFVIKMRYEEEQNG
ncbi:HAMP domain-containing protein [bacterium]|nr:HAMP domain-containing protein [bacterium]